MRTSSSHEEGCERLWSVNTTKLTGEGGQVKQLYGCSVEWTKDADGWKVKELPGTDFVFDTDFIILAMGFLHIDHNGLINDLGLKLDKQGNLAVKNYQTSEPMVFAAGDAVSGVSLVVRAISSGREAAEAIDHWLQGKI
jgi:glutamate synthase (NADPH/NADH) small chain